MAMRILEKGVRMYPNSVFLLICHGEVLSQIGDVMKAIQCFKKAANMKTIEGFKNPLPYVNAARTYQQLSQPLAALTHISIALKYDCNLPMTYVDLSQIYLHIGRTKEALQALDHALEISKYCSEIRDVLSAQAIARMQLELEESEGIRRPQCIY